MRQLVALVFLLTILIQTSLASPSSLTVTTSADPCAGPGPLLSILDRPTVQDSVCVVSPGRMIVEMGTAYTSYRNNSHGYNFPEAEFRYGLPWDSEISLLAPNYYLQQPSGVGAASLALKHRIAYSEKWVLTTEGIIILPTGGELYGSSRTGGTLAGIFEWEITSNLAFTSMISASTQTEPTANGGHRFTTFNPDIVLTWQASDKLQFFGEIYGQTKTAAKEGPGYNFDTGVQYLITPNIEIDAEDGFRLSGNLGGLRNYVGVGMGFLL